MATELSWTSTSKLGCSKCLPADVILCIAAGKVAPFECSYGYADPYDEFQLNTLDAQLLSLKCYKKNGVIYTQYKFTYDETKLVDPSTPLVEADIKGVVCEGCLSQWIREQVGNEIFVEQYGDVVTIISQHGCEFTIDVSGGELSCESVLACINVDPETISGDGSVEYPFSAISSGGGLDRSQGTEYFNDFIDYPSLVTPPEGQFGLHAYGANVGRIQPSYWFGNGPTSEPGAGVLALYTEDVGDACGIFSAFNAGLTPFAGNLVIEWRGTVDVSEADEEVIVLLGLGIPDVGFLPPNAESYTYPFLLSEGAYFLYDRSAAAAGSAGGDLWQTVTTRFSYNATYNENYTPFPVSTSNSSFHKFRIEIDSPANGDEARFYIDDVLIGRHTTNIPDAVFNGIGIYSYIERLTHVSVPTDPKQLYLDYVYLRQTFDNPR